MAKGDSVVESEAELYPAHAYNNHDSRNADLNEEKFSVHDVSEEGSGIIQSSISDDAESEEKSIANLVTWEGPNDPTNPMNWSLQRKWANTTIVSAFTLISTLSSSMATPALRDIGNDLHIPNGIQLQLVLSIFVLAYSFGPFVLSPCSEIWGRARVIQVGNLIFILFNTICGFAQTQAQLTVFRFIAGFGGSATIGMGGAVLSDCWHAEERGRGMSIYQLAPVLGPTIGPIAGGFIVENMTWRWTFWSITFINVFIQLIGAIFLKETYAPRILLLKARKLRQQTGNPMLRTRWESEDRTLPSILRISLRRPWQLLAAEPIIQLLAIYQAYNFGMLYLLISSFPSLWEGRYGMPTGIASLNYLSLALGSLVGAQICGPLTDTIYRRLKKRYGYADDALGSPEFRIPLMIPASIITPCGVFLYGWCAEAKVHWLLPNIGAGLFVCGSMISYQCFQTYLVDTYTRYAASASAASASLRSLAAFSFPLFAPYLYRDLGYGWGSSVLGLAAMVIGLPAPFILWRYGQRLRKQSLFAS